MSTNLRMGGMKAPNNKRLSAEERKKVIVKSAITAFGKSNYRATRMADIAAEAGVSEAMLYKHFESKKAMFLSILENVSKRTETAIGRELGEEPDALMQLRRSRIEYYNQIEEHPNLLKLHFQAVSEIDDEEIGGHIKKDHEAYVHSIKELIKKGIEQGTVRKDIEIDPIAWLFNGIGLLISMMVLLSRDGEIKEGIAEKMIDHLIESIRA